MAVNRLENGKWRVRVKSGGNVVADRVFVRKGDALSWEADQKRSLALGTFVSPQKGRVSVQQLADDWMTQRIHSVSPKTLETDRDNIGRLPATLRNRPIGTVRSADLDALYADLLSRLARSTVTRARNSYSSLFAWAESQGRISINPVLKSKVPRGTGTAEKHEVWPFSYDELHAVVDSIRIVSPANADIVLFLGLTGLRWGELVALRVRDVSTIPTYTLRISRTKSDRQLVRSTTKSGKVRSVPLVAELVPLVQARMKGKTAETPLFTTARGAMLAGPNFKRATHWSELGLSRRIHDLRHTAATLWLSNGVDLKTAQQWLGHSSAKLTADLYAHWLGTDADAAAVARLNANLGDTAGTRAQSEKRA